MTKKSFYIILLLVLGIVLFNGFVHVAYAWQKIEQKAYTITDFEFIEDVGGEFSFDEIRSLAVTNRFKPSPQSVISLGITQSVYWVRFQLPTEDRSAIGTSQYLQLNNPNIDKIDVFIPVAGNTIGSEVHYLTKAVGVSRPSANREIWDNTWVFPLSTQYPPNQFVYLRLESASALRLPVLLWRENSFITQAFMKSLGFGAFYGILMAMLLFNLFIFFVLRDKAYLFYVSYIGFMLLYQFQVHGHLKLWLDTSYEIYNAIFWVCLTAAFVSSIYFTSNFLHVHREDAPWNKIMAVIVALALVQGGLGVFGFTIWANQIAHGLGLVGPLVIMALAIIRFRQGFRPARYYLLAWGVLSIGIVVWVLAAYIPDTVYAVNYLLVATASESILLSFALADRFKTLRLKEAVLTKHIQYYRDLSLTDELTGLYNKRYLIKRIEQEIDIALQVGMPLTMMVIDIDHFKTYNDSYGHWEGDRVLIRLAAVLLAVLESSQLAFRYGGEEFVVLLPSVNCDAVMPIAERFRKKIQSEEFAVASDRKVTVTVSIGLAEVKAEDNSRKLFQRADEAMYRAKKSGRNQVICG